MPEGPELYKAAQYLNKIGAEYLFSTVRLLYEPSYKRPEIPWNKPKFHLSAKSRGKEIQISLVEEFGAETKKSDKKPELLKILLTFGMTGRFAFTPLTETQKHSMLMFDTVCKKHTFAFVDSRHFGRWTVTDLWSPESKRGPDIISEYQLFRSHVLNSLDKSVFDKAICEVLLDQRYFSSIGNYLRAEVLYRMDIDPFMSARDALQDLPEVCDEKKTEKEQDILYTCHKLCWEVINLAGSGKPYDPYGIFGDFNIFENWLQCYMKEGMGNSIDNKGRTIWHDAKYGTNKKRRHMVLNKSKEESYETEIGPAKVKKVKSESKSVKGEEIKNERESESKVMQKARRQSERNKIPEVSNENDKENLRKKRPATKSQYFEDKPDSKISITSDYFTSSGRKVKRTKL